MMDLKALFTEDDAVSPVIGVILMVAITVILAAVIGAFVLNIGGNQETAPQNQFDWEYSNSSDSLIVSHGGGGSLDATTLAFSGDWGTNYTNQCQISTQTGLSAGQNVVDDSPGTTGGSACNHGANSGNTLELTWTSSNGEQSQIIAESQVP